MIFLTLSLFSGILIAKFEVKYAALLPNDTGNVAKLFRMALGALIIQTKFQYSDCELVEQIAENSYLQYFIGLLGFQEEACLMQVRWFSSENPFQQKCSWK